MRCSKKKDLFREHLPINLGCIGSEESCSEREGERKRDLSSLFFAIRPELS
jgi:hypothetical protein